MAVALWDVLGFLRGVVAASRERIAIQCMASSHWHTGPSPHLAEQFTINQILHLLCAATVGDGGGSGLHTSIGLLFAITNEQPFQKDLFCMYLDTTFHDHTLLTPSNWIFGGELDCSPRQAADWRIVTWAIPFGRAMSGQFGKSKSCKLDKDFHNH